MKVPLVVLLGLLLVLAVAAVHETLRRALAGLFGLLHRPFIMLAERVGTALRWLVARIGDAVRPDGGVDSASGTRGWRGWPVVGALLYVAAFAAFTYAEFWLLVLTLGALFGFETPEAPVSAEALTGLAFLGVGFFWGMVLLDALGITPLGPWDRLSPRGHQVVVAVSVVAVVLTLVLAGLLGIWRMNQVATPPADDGSAPLDSVTVIQANPLDTDGNASDSVSAHGFAPPEAAGDVVIPRIVGAGLPVLVGASMVGSGWGVAASLRYLWALGLVVLAVPLGLVHTVVQVAAGLIDMAFTFVDHTVAFLAQGGRTLWNWLTRFAWVQEVLRFRPLSEPTDAPPPQQFPGATRTSPSETLGASEPESGESSVTAPVAEEGGVPDPAWDPLGDRREARRP